MSLCCNQRSTSWDYHTISWNYSENDGTDQLLDRKPQMFLYGSQYLLGMQVDIYNGQYSTASERGSNYQQTGRDRQDLTFQFHSIICIAESLWMWGSRSASVQWSPPLSFAPCTPGSLLLQKSIPIWLFVADVLVRDCSHNKASEKCLVMSKRAQAFKFLRAYIATSLSELRMTQVEDCSDQIRVVLQIMLHKNFSDDSNVNPIFSTLAEIDYPLSCEKFPCGYVECVEGCKPIQFHSNSHRIHAMTVADHIRQIAHNLVIDRDLCRCAAQLYTSFVRTTDPTIRDSDQHTGQRSKGKISSKLE